MTVKSASAANGLANSHILNDGPLALAQSSADTLIAAHLRLYRQIEAVNRKWLNRLSETRESEAALRGSLLSCSNPIEAAGLCRDWIQKRASTLASDMQSFGSMWLEFYSQTVSPGSETEKAEAQTAVPPAPRV